MNLIIVMHRSTFPNIEARFYKRSQEPGKESLTPIKIESLRYERKYLHGGSGCRSDDVFLAPDGSFLFPKNDFIFKIKPIIGAPKRNFEATYESSTYLVGMGFRFSDQVFILDKKDVYEIVTGPRAALNIPKSWRDVKISEAKIIALPSPNDFNDSLNK